MQFFFYTYMLNAHIAYVYVKSLEIVVYMIEIKTKKNQYENKTWMWLLL